MSAYNPETYWSEVADRIDKRTGRNVIAGDDEPYYEYKRERFIKLLKSIDFANKSVLEIGCGPGGNLIEIEKLAPSKLHAVDISEKMVRIAKANNSDSVEIFKVDGSTLPFEDRTYDMVLTSTVLQHNTDEDMLMSLIKEITRVGASDIYIFERIESTIQGDDLCLGRPIDYYRSAFEREGFQLMESQFLNINTSYFVCGMIRKLMNPISRSEGEPMNAIATLLQKLVLPITKMLDNMFPSKRDVAKLHFRRNP